MGLLACALLLLGPNDLSRYVNVDLGKLKSAEKEAFVSRYEASVGKLPVPNNQAWVVPTPAWIWSYPAAGGKWIGVDIAMTYSVPGAAVIKLHLLDANWKEIAESEFSTGYRLDLREVKLVQIPGFASPLVRAKVTSQGPFVVEEGKPAKPLFHPESGIREYFAFSNGEAVLVRLEDGNERVVGNSYSGGFPIGPYTSGKSAAWWKAALASDDPVRQSMCMVWLSGRHLLSTDWRRKGFAREAVADSIAYEEVKGDAATKARLQALMRSNTAWIKQAALLTLKQIAIVQEPDDPPR